MSHFHKLGRFLCGSPQWDSMTGLLIYRVTRVLNCVLEILIQYDVVTVICDIYMSYMSYIPLLLARTELGDRRTLNHELSLYASVW